MVAQNISLAPKRQPPWVRRVNKTRLEANITRVKEQHIEPIIVPAGVTDLRQLPGYSKPRKKRPKKEQPVNNSNHVTAVADLQPGPGREITELLDMSAVNRFREEMAAPPPVEPPAPVIVEQPRRGRRANYTEAQIREWYAEYQKKRSVAVVARAHGIRPDILGKLFKRYG